MAQAVASSRPLTRGPHGHGLSGVLGKMTVMTGLGLLLALGHVGGSYALFNDTANVDAGAVVAGTVGVATTVTPALTHTYASNQRTTTSGLLVTNTGNVPARMETHATLGGEPSTALAAAIDVLVWPTANISSCTPEADPSSPTSSTLLALTASATPLHNELDAGASVAYCLRTFMDVTDAAGIPSGSGVTPIFSTTATVGETWTATAAAEATQTFLDDINPTVPMGLSSSGASSTSTTLSWNASTDNVGVVAYEVHRDGEWLANIESVAGALTFTDTLEPMATHTYTVVARDAADNVSAHSEELTVVTGLGLDGYFTLTNVKTDTCVTHPTGASDKKPVHDNCTEPVPAQQMWRLVSNGDNRYFIHSVLKSGMAISHNPKIDIPSPTNQYLWEVVPVDGHYVFRTPVNSQCLAVNNKKDDKKLKTSSCDTTAAEQRFVLAAVNP